jgi:DNA topoisomerase II
VPMQPWFRGFQGTVQEAGQDRFKFSGKASKTGNTEIEILELPVRVWTQDFKERLEDMIKAEKTPSLIKDYKDYNTHEKVRFVIQMEEKHVPNGTDEEVTKELEEKFKLSKSIATSNLVAFDAEGRIAKYATVEDIMKDFFRVRIMYYEKRKVCCPSKPRLWDAY